MKSLSGFRVSVQRGMCLVQDAVATELFANRSIRGVCDHFSQRSRCRLQRFIRNSALDYPVFGTLTYPPGCGMSPESAKRDLKCFLERVRRATCRHDTNTAIGLDGLPWSVIWWMEFQSNGRIHFHFSTTHQMPKSWLSRAWYEVVGSENEYHLKAGTRIEFLHGNREQMRAYASKYAAKSEQKDVPDSMDNPGRFWGIWGDRSTVEASTFVPGPVLAWPNIAELRMNLEKSIQDFLKSGEITGTEEYDDGCKAYFFKGAHVHSCLSRIVHHMASAAGNYSAGYMLTLRGQGLVCDFDEPRDDELEFRKMKYADLTSLGSLDYADSLHSAAEPLPPSPLYGE